MREDLYHVFDTHHLIMPHTPWGAESKDLLLSKDISHYAAKLTAAVFTQYQMGYLSFFPNLSKSSSIIYNTITIKNYKQSCQRDIQDQLMETWVWICKYTGSVFFKRVFLEQKWQICWCKRKKELLLPSKERRKKKIMTWDTSSSPSHHT